jgi:hypothetical protein
VLAAVARSRYSPIERRSSAGALPPVKRRPNWRGSLASAAKRFTNICGRSDVEATALALSGHIQVSALPRHFVARDSTCAASLPSPPQRCWGPVGAAGAATDGGDRPAVFRLHKPSKKRRRKSPAISAMHVNNRQLSSRYPAGAWLNYWSLFSPSRSAASTHCSRRAFDRRHRVHSAQLDTHRNCDAGLPALVLRRGQQLRSRRSTSRRRGYWNFHRLLCRASHRPGAAGQFKRCPDDSK